MKGGGSVSKNNISVWVYIQNMPGEFAPVHSGYCSSLQALQWRYRKPVRQLFWI